MENALSRLRKRASITDGELARRSGVSRSTLHRIDNGTASPTLRTLRELAIAAGLDIDVNYTPLSDPDAARAARRLLEPLFVEASRTAGEAEWINRLDPNGDAEPIALLERAGDAANLRHRVGVIAVDDNIPALRLASAGDASKGNWAISGAAALRSLRRSDAVTLAGPTVLHCEDPHRAWRLLDAPQRSEADTTNGLIIAPWLPEHSIDAWAVDHVRHVAPVQILLDCIGLGGSLRPAALNIAREW